MTTSLRVPLLNGSRDVPNGAGSPRRVIELRSAVGDRLLLELFDDPEPWLRHILDHVEQLLSLRQGWNSYAAAPVTIDAAAAMLEIIRETLSATMPPPHVSPLSSGGIQMEWHERDLDVEVVVDRSGEASLWYEDARSGVSEDVQLDRPYDRLRYILGELAGRE